LPDKARIAAHLEQGDVDLFVGTAEDGSNELIASTLFEDEFVTAQRIGHPRGNQPITLDEFCSLDHLLVSTSLASSKAWSMQRLQRWTASAPFQCQSKAMRWRPSS
jgi:DNA-binding transcriptional LysR family regulator